MCGINGILGVVDLDSVEKMNAITAHRGPDAGLVKQYNRATLGHRRLSIIDLDERSHQPFEKNGWTIVFNGEIYNYKEIRQELADIVCSTTSDTEVVLDAWIKWGEAALDKFQGMFAFAIYHIDTGDAWLVRDHFGIKPLYFSRLEDRLIFSSEIKAIKTVCGDALQVNSEAILASLLYVWVPEEQCIWDKVEKLKPGYLIRYNTARGAFEEHQYWNSSSLLKSTIISDEQESINLVDSVLAESVENHLVADVPVNAFLSGGLDSSLIVAMAKRHLDNLDCYTIKFSDKDKALESMTDDAFYAKKVADHVGVRLHTIEVNPDLTTLLPKIVSHLDEPIGDSAAINTYLICDAARRQGVKVLLSGMGADEMFGGYRKHIASLIAQRYRYIPAFIRQSIIEAPLSLMPVSSDSGGLKLIRWAKRFTSFAGLEPVDSYLRSYSYYDDAVLEEGFVDDIKSHLETLKQQHNAKFSTALDQQREFLDAMCFTDINHFMVSLNLMYSDKASMAASTEIRVPFINRKVMEAAFKISPSLKIKGGQQKYILKKVAENWLPKEVIYRPKASFTMPLRSWVREELSDMIDDYLLSQSGLAGRGILKRPFIEKLIEDERKGKEDNAQKIWQLLTLEQWLKNQGASNDSQLVQNLS